jgi:quercetin dioxygenase-like cupin family protein
MRRLRFNVSVPVALLFAQGTLMAAGPAQPAKAESGRADASSSEHRVFQPEQLKWKDGPAALPPGAKYVVLEGDPSKEGYFAMRVKLPAGYRIPPHTHPNVERVTVLSGTLNLGMGATFDPKAGEALRAGSYFAMPTGMQHFAWTDGEVELQLATLGPWAVHYVNPADDPRRKKE